LLVTCVTGFFTGGSTFTSTVVSSSDSDSELISNAANMDFFTGVSFTGSLNGLSAFMVLARCCSFLSFSSLLQYFGPWPFMPQYEQTMLFNVGQHTKPLSSRTLWLVCIETGFPESKHTLQKVRGLEVDDENFDDVLDILVTLKLGNGMISIFIEKTFQFFLEFANFD
jgi:hypothetical protein